MKFKPALRSILVMVTWGSLALTVVRAGEGPAPLPAEEQKRIEDAVPTNAPAKPVRSRHLLIFTRNVGYGGHPSIHYANYAFTLMGKKTGAFETTISDDPAIFEKASLQRFDAVFFNNTVGNCFTNATLRQNLLEFITGGGGLMGVHGTTVAFTQWPGAVEDWPEFGNIIGARGANHKESTEAVWVKVEEPVHPLSAVLGAGAFEYRDEFFRVHDPYSRKRLRVLLSMDTTKTDPNRGEPRGNCFREDNDYAFSWIRSYGQGRVFYSTIAHNPYVFWDPKMLQYYLGAIQFVLGDLRVPTTPSAYLNAATLAREQLGWRFGVEAYTFHKFTFLETIEKTAQLGLPFIGGLSFQKVSEDIPRNFDPDLSDSELAAIRQRLEKSGLRLLTYYIHDIPGEEAACSKIFEFGRKMGIETFLTEPKLEALNTIEKFADQYGINIALHNHDAKASPAYWSPEKILEACKGRSKRIGACADIGYWMRSGVDPVRALGTLKDRLITVQIHDLDTLGPEGQDVPWGTGAAPLGKFFVEMQNLMLQPTMIGLEYSRDWLESMPKVAASITYFDELSVVLAQ